MSDNGPPDALTTRLPYLKAAAARRGAGETTAEGEEETCPAFGFLRGSTARALAVEFRFLNGNSDIFPYSHLAGWRFNPSVGLLLRFTADVVSLVLVRGSNLDAPVNTDGVNMLDRGFQRHRVTWVRAMDPASLKAVGAGGPTVDAIEVGEFESLTDLREWVRAKAPAFLR
ncbi:hypothetical protein [Fimbriiglobus ruber]|uniref:Uncharacterized protein n=1 Tax=Fimbriiglobus ruber TaxID=1908690 RepID=A0A225EG75_9BACT|nr:hypothetical protein [Fimbriiglobus ruber]OWK47335.1 hypothetical protein FRUB_01034 [Fimbriiglobus ruber]